MKPNIIIFSLEPLESRYTSQWHSHIPALLSDQLGDKFNIIQIDGDTNSGLPTKGAFLDFLSTNQWKNEQANKFFTMIKQGRINKGDHLLFTDAWNPTVIEMRYVSDLMGMDWKIHGQWHAGSYDNFDFLGRIIGDAKWVRNSERSFFHAIDYNYFATYFHIDMFLETLLGIIEGSEISQAYVKLGKIIRTGWPMEYMVDTLTPYKNMEKRDLILFPHRIAPEKQVEIFRDLADSLPQYEFIVCQDKQLTKHEYHTLLGQAKIVFSASLQETLGIGCYEGAIVDAIPFVPDRLSYVEMYFQDFRYPSEWTEDWASYKRHKDQLVNHLSWTMIHYKERIQMLNQQTNLLTKRFFSANELVGNFHRSLSDDK